MGSPRYYARSRGGLSLIELLVVIAVISIVSALVVSAVLRAREAARRFSCISNLKQIGIAIHQYAGVHGVMPPAIGTPAMTPSRLPLFERKYSAFTQILPFLEEGELYLAINFDVPLDDPYVFPQEPNSRANLTAFGTRVATLLCPSDGAGVGAIALGGCNYRVNLGAQRRALGSNRYAGPFSVPRTNVRLSAIRDGLSNTAAVSEKLRGLPGDRAFNRRTDMVMSVLALPGRSGAPPSACSALVAFGGFPFYDHAGYSWGLGGIEATAYNHVIPPNSRDVDCVWRANPVIGAVTSRSNHLGSVNVLICDGSTRTVRGTLELSVWMALGTRAGGEIVSQ